MKKLLLFIGVAFYSSVLLSQVGIGTTEPTPSAMLEIKSTVDGGNTYKGFMPPRVPTIVARNLITPNISEAGLMVFVMNNGAGESCLQIWDGGVWTNIFCVTIPSPEIWINEFHYKNKGTDAGEFVEIAGPTGTDLSLYSLYFYNGATGTNYKTVALSGILPNTSNNIGVLSFPIADIQNGPNDGIAIVRGSVVVQFLSYEGVLMATTGPANGVNSTDVGVKESTNTTDPGYSLQLSGTGNSYNDFLWNNPRIDSPGSINTGQTFN